jgi:hypothetical protein
MEFAPEEKRKIRFSSPSEGLEWYEFRTSFNKRSEEQLERQLADSWAPRAGDSPKSAGTQAAVRIVEIDSVESIKELSPELKPEVLRHGEILEQSHVPREMSRASETILR